MMIDRSSIGRRNRRRGKQKDRDAAEKLRPAYPDARATYASGATPFDKGDVRAGPWLFQVKSGLKPNYRTALDEAKRDAVNIYFESGETPYAGAITAEKQPNGRIRWVMHVDPGDFVEYVGGLLQTRKGEDS